MPHTRLVVHGFLQRQLFRWCARTGIQPVFFECVTAPDREGLQVILADAFGDERQLGVEHHRHLPDHGRKKVVASLGEHDCRATKRVFAADGHARPCAQPAETTDRVGDGRSHPSARV